MNVYKNLEFDIILNKIAALSSSNIVADNIRKTLPTTDIDLAKKLLRQTGDAITILASHRPKLAFDDITPILSKAKVGSVLSPKELLDIITCIGALRSVKSCVDDADGCDSLKDITAYARVCDELEHTIEVTIENETDIKDGASEKLYSIRKAIIRANAKLKEKLDSFTHQSDISKYLQDNIVTLRGGRYVLPVRSECRSNVKGLVHDVSSTGATVFIEPFAVVEANNEIITLKTEESNEIERILAEISGMVVRNVPDLLVGQKVLEQCGAIFAKAEYAKQIDAYCPMIDENGKIVLKGARHPLIDPARVVPVDIALNDKKVLLISGPNTGGKTVALKTVGLFALLAASGIFLPANDGSTIGIFNNIYCDIGDSQSIAQSLSTFSAHVANLSEITNGMDEKSLVLLDEVGDGTDPDEGAALAIAIIKKLLKSKVTAIVTTHFNAVKEFALSCSEISNACMQFDNVNLRPTYKLMQGVCGSSYALDIAERLGLSSDIIEDARAALSTEKLAFDKIMREAEILRNETLAEKQRCEILLTQAQDDAEQAKRAKQDYERKLSEINDKARAMIKQRADEYSDRAENIIEQIKEMLKHADEAALFEARRVAKQLHSGVPIDEVKPETSKLPPKPAELSVGTEVFISGFNKQGIVAACPKGKTVTVAIGSIKTEVPISSLSIIKTAKAKTAHISHAPREPENKEIILLGKTVDEAIGELDLLLSDLAPHSVLRIVHGKGTGALGKGIQAYLKKCSMVKTFRYGRYGEGDTGVTIVEIK